jgi:hypothetical protein
MSPNRMWRDIPDHHARLRRRQVGRSPVCSRVRPRERGRGNCLQSARVSRDREVGGLGALGAPARSSCCLSGAGGNPAAVDLEEHPAGAAETFARAPEGFQPPFGVLAVPHLRDRTDPPASTERGRASAVSTSPHQKRKIGPPGLTSDCSWNGAASQPSLRLP